MEIIDFEVFQGFAETARAHMLAHGGYDFHIRDHYVWVNENSDMIYCAHSKYFDVILAESWRIMSSAPQGIEGFTDLMRAIWDSPDLGANQMSFKEDLDIPFDNFVYLVKKQFFYFDNQTDLFLFPLFRLLEDDGDVTGGFFHFLIKHFEQYSILHKTSNQSTQYWPNDVLGILVSTCTWPDTTEETEASNVPEDLNSIRKRVCQYYDRETNSYEEKSFKALLYYDSASDMYFLTSFYRC